MDKPKPRRWFRFSLRTMFVLVTVLCVWLGYHLNWIRQRHEFLSTLSEDRVGFQSEVPSVQIDKELPWSLRILGERAVFALQLAGINDLQIEERSREAERIFPEAHINTISYIP